MPKPQTGKAAVNYVRIPIDEQTQTALDWITECENGYGRYHTKRDRNKELIRLFREAVAARALMEDAFGWCPPDYALRGYFHDFRLPADKRIRPAEYEIRDQIKYAESVLAANGEGACHE